MNKRTTHIVSRIILWLCFFIVMALIVTPLYWMVISSLKDGTEALQSPIVWFGFDVTFDNYVKMIRDMRVDIMAWNTLVITFFALLISTVACTMASYAFARFMSTAMKIPYYFLLLSAMVPAIVAVRPLYDVFRNAKLINTFPGLIILYTSSLIPFSVLVLTNFCNAIPMGIDEAAGIDGASAPKIVFRIILPLLLPAISTISIVNFITCLNDFFTPLIFSEDIITLSLGIVSVPNLTGFYQPWELIATMGCIILLPITIFVFFSEKYIIDGLVTGSIKA
ncbi:MAG TPA: carbohydrate ABC transporter permease [Candidatus Limiplasma sp.]|mgnify:CR=1 FL=1|nr:carbohydrate ABC transporter permease [Candidatus Limiplasma sp.]